MFYQVAKFEGVKLKTVSGIRGQIKKSVREGAAGSFRATFEDKVSFLPIGQCRSNSHIAVLSHSLFCTGMSQILMSDIIICRMWVPVEVKKYYNPVLSLLEAQGPQAWRGMRTIADIRKEAKIAIPVNKDSLYKPIERVPRQFRKLVVPQKLQEALPFASKPKMAPALNPASYVARRAVILEPEDKKKRAVVQMLSAIRNDKVGV